MLFVNFSNLGHSKGERNSETERVNYFERNAGGKPLHKSVVTVYDLDVPVSPIELNFILKNN